jgi:hypothetical protein
MRSCHESAEAALISEVGFIRNFRGAKARSIDIVMIVYEYVVPTKQIVSPSDLHAFIHSDTYGLIYDFIEDLSKAVEDTPIRPDIKTSKVPVSGTGADRRMLRVY